MRLALRMVIRRPAAVIATLFAALFAAAMVTTCGALLESGLEFHGTVARYAAAPVVIATTSIRNEHRDHGDTETETASLDTARPLPGWLVTELPRTPGVGSVVADVSVPATIFDGRSVAVHPWTAAPLGPFRLLTGHAPAAGQVVLDERSATQAGLGVGARFEVWTAAGPRAVTLSGVAAASGAAAATAFVDSATMRSLAPGEPQVLGVLPRPGVSTGQLAAEIRALIAARHLPPTGAQPGVYTGAGRGAAETTGIVQARQYLIVLSSVFGGTTLLVAGFVIANTVGLSVRQRMRDIALLRAMAATPAQVRRMVVGEAFFVALLGCAPAIPLAHLGIDRLRSGFISHGLVPAGFHGHVSWLPPLVAGAAVVLVSVVAGWVAALRTSRVRPTVALAETVVEPSGLGVFRLLAGLVALAGGITVLLVAALVPAAAQPVAIATIVLFTLAAALLGPLLLRVVAGSVGRLALVFGAPGRLAAATLGTAARRLSPVLCSIVLAVGLGGGMWFVLTTEQHVAADQVADGLRAQQVVVPAGAGLPPSVSTELRAVPGITAVSATSRGTLFTPDDQNLQRGSVLGVDPAGLGRTLDLAVTAGDLNRLAGDTIAVDTLTARQMHLHLGSSLRGWFGDGAPTTLHVVALYRRGLGFGQFAMARSALAPHVVAGLDNAVYLTGTPQGLALAGARLATVAPPGTRLVSAGQYRLGLSADQAANAWANQIIVAVLLGYVAIAALNTLLVHTLARRREFGVLRLAGTTRRQVLGMVALEHGLLLGTALLIGIGIAASALLPSVHAVTGSARPYLPPADILGLLAVTVLATSAAVALPARRALRTRAVEAAAARE